MSNKFLSSSGGNLSNGTANINVKDITVAGMLPSLPMKTNSFKQLVSTKLDISDVNELQSTLDSTITNPYNQKLVVTDLETSLYVSVNDVLETIDNFTASALNETNINGIVKVPEIAIDSMYDTTKATRIDLSATAVDVVGGLTHNSRSVISEIGGLNLDTTLTTTQTVFDADQQLVSKKYVDDTAATDSSSKTQNIVDAGTTAGVTEFTGKIINAGEFILETTQAIKLSGGLGTEATGDFTVTGGTTTLNPANMIINTSVAMNSNRITGLGDPIAGTDAASKNYVDSKNGGTGAANAITNDSSVLQTMTSSLTLSDGVLSAISFKENGNAAKLIKSSDGNLICGDNTGLNANGNDCVYLGTWAGKSGVTTQNSVGIGAESLRYATGDFNTALGSRAMLGDSATAGFCENNVCVGTNSLRDISVVNECVALGSRADANLVNGQNRVAIGYNSSTSADNQVSIGNTLTTTNIMRGELFVPIVKTDRISTDTAGVFVDDLLPSVNSVSLGSIEREFNFVHSKRFRGDDIIVGFVEAPTIRTVSIKNVAGNISVGSTLVPEFDDTDIGTVANKFGTVFSQTVNADEIISPLVTATTVVANSVQATTLDDVTYLQLTPSLQPSKQEGRVYYDINERELRVYNGTDWVAFAFIVVYYILTPKMESNAQDGCVVISSSELPEFNAWKAFNRLPAEVDGQAENGWETVNGFNPVDGEATTSNTQAGITQAMEYITIELDAPTNIHSYKIKMRNIQTAGLPKDFTLRGRDGAGGWSDLDVRTEIEWGGRSQFGEIEFVLTTPSKFTALALLITRVSAGASSCYVGEIKFMGRS